MKPCNRELCKVPRGFVHTHVHCSLFSYRHEKIICKGLIQGRLCKAPIQRSFKKLLGAKMGFTKPLYRGSFVKPVGTLYIPYKGDLQSSWIVGALLGPIQMRLCETPLQTVLCEVPI